MSEIATIVRTHIPLKLDTNNCNTVMSSIGNALNTMNSILSLIPGSPKELNCFVLTFPNGEKEFFHYKNNEYDILQKAINCALSKNFNVSSKYISLLSSGKINKLILKR
jgi:hypothetical protein